MANEPKNSPRQKRKRNAEEQAHDDVTRFLRKKTTDIAETKRAEISALFLISCKLQTLCEHAFDSSAALATRPVGKVLALCGNCGEPALEDPGAWPIDCSKCGETRVHPLPPEFQRAYGQ